MKKTTLPFESKDFEHHWNLWKQYKKEQHRFNYKSELSERTALSHLEDISDNDEQQAIKIILHSIAQGWKGLFKIERNGTNMQATAERKLGTSEARIDALKGWGLGGS